MQFFSLTGNPFFDFLLLAWAIIWKGLALWAAAKNHQKYWFIALLIVNAYGLLEILYLFRFAKKKMTIDDLRFWDRIPRK